MTTDTKPLVVERIEDLENRYTDVGLNTKTFPVSDAIDLDRSDIAASSKAVKTAYDAGTRYATTEQQGQVILSHDVDSGEDDKALTPFGAKEYADALEQQFKIEIENILNQIKGEIQKIQTEVLGKLPLFDNATAIGITKNQLLAPVGASKWVYFAQWTITYNNGGTDASDFTASDYTSFGFCVPGEQILAAALSSTISRRSGSITFWRVFK